MSVEKEEIYADDENYIMDVGCVLHQLRKSKIMQNIEFTKVSKTRTHFGFEIFHPSKKKFGFRDHYGQLTFWKKGHFTMDLINEKHKFENVADVCKFFQTNRNRLMQKCKLRNYADYLTKDYVGNEILLELTNMKRWRFTNSFTLATDDSYATFGLSKTKTPTKVTAKAKAEAKAEAKAKAKAEAKAKATWKIEPDLSITLLNPDALKENIIANFPNLKKNQKFANCLDLARYFGLESQYNHCNRENDGHFCWNG